MHTESLFSDSLQKKTTHSLGWWSLSSCWPCKVTMHCLLTQPLKRKPKHLPSLPSIHFPLTEQPNLHKAGRPGGQHDSWGAASGVHQAPWRVDVCALVWRRASGKHTSQRIWTGPHLAPSVMFYNSPLPVTGTRRLPTEGCQLLCHTTATSLILEKTVTTLHLWEDWTQPQVWHLPQGPCRALSTWEGQSSTLECTVWAWHLSLTANSFCDS